MPKLNTLPILETTLATFKYLEPELQKAKHTINMVADAIATQNRILSHLLHQLDTQTAKENKPCQTGPKNPPKPKTGTPSA